MSVAEAPSFSIPRDGGEYDSRWPLISRKKYRRLAVDHWQALLGLKREQWTAGFYRKMWDAARKELEEVKEERDNWRKEASK